MLCYSLINNLCANLVLKKQETQKNQNCLSKYAKKKSMVLKK